MYRLIVTDIDGTLYDDHKRVSSADMKAVKKLRQMGIGIVLSSGRHYRGMFSLAQELGLTRFRHIATNGTCLFTTGGDVSYTGFMDGEGYGELVGYLRKTSESYVTIAKDAIYYEKSDDSVIRALGKNNGDAPYVRTDDLEGIRNPYQVIAHYSSAENRDEIMKRIPDSVFGCVTFTEQEVPDVHGLIDYVAEGIDKLAALKIILSDAGIGTDEVIGVGNSDNDIPIVRGAGVGLCVKDSSENLRKTADRVLSRTNNESPFEEILDMIISKEI